MKKKQKVVKRKKKVVEIKKRIVNGGRKPSNKTKQTKVSKLKMMAKSKPKKKGFFGWFSR